MLLAGASLPLQTSVLAGSLALGSLAVPLLGAFLSGYAAPALAAGGRGGNGDTSGGGSGGTGGGGGSDSAAGVGGTGGDGTGTVGGGGGGGGGAGATGGPGGRGATGSAPGDPGWGGGGGSHGWIDPAVPGGSPTGNPGLPGVDGGSLSGGGGGGAGGYGAVVTGTGLLSPVVGNIVGGAGGRGGDSHNDYGGSGGSGGIGLLFTNTGASKELVIQGTVTGGAGGAGGTGVLPGADGTAGAGGEGIVGAGLVITISATGSVAGGMSGAGVQANALHFTGGAVLSSELHLVPRGPNYEAGIYGGILIDSGMLTISQATDVRLPNVISGGGGIDVTGNGALWLTANNSYTGTTRISAGTLAVGRDANLGDPSSSVVLVGVTPYDTGTGGGLSSVLKASASFASDRTISFLSYGGRIHTMAGATLTLNGTLTGGSAPQAAFVKEGPGSLVLTGDSSNPDPARGFLGAVRVDAGTLIIQAGGKLGSTMTDEASIAGNAAVVVTGTGSAWIVNSLVVGSRGAGSLTISDGGLVMARSAVAPVVAGSAGGGVGRINIGAAEGSAAAPAGSLAAASVSLASSDSRFVFNHSNLSYSIGLPITGAGGVRQLEGTTVLTGINSYAGGTEIVGGRLQVGADVNLGSSSGELTFTGGTLRTTGSFATPRQVVLNGPGRFDVAATTTLTLSGAVSGSGILVKAGAGTLQLTSAGGNAYRGTLVEAGTLVGAASTISGTVENAGTVVFEQSAPGSFAGDIGGWNGTRGQMIKRGTGTLTLAGTSSLDWSVEAGTLAASAAGFAGNAAISTGATLTFDETATASYAGTLSGAGGLAKTGAGTLMLTGTVGHTGLTTVAGGTLQFGDGTVARAYALSGSIQVAAGTLAIARPTTLHVAQQIDFSNNSTLSIVAGATDPALAAERITIGSGVAFNLSGVTSVGASGKVLIDTVSGISGDFASVTIGGYTGSVDYLTLNTVRTPTQYLATYGLSWTAGNSLAHGTFTLTDASNSFTVATALSDRAANAATGWDGRTLTKAGAGTLILTADNSYSGGTIITGGTLQLGDGGATGSITGHVANDGTLAFNRSDVSTFAGTISGSGGLRQMGPGTTVLTGENSYGGGTEIAGGTLQVSRDVNLGSSAGGLRFSGGTLAATASFETARAVTLSGTGRFDVAAGTELGLTGTVRGAGDLVKAGTGTLRLAGASNAYGNTLVEGGTLIGHAGALSGAIGNAGTVIFEQAADASFAGSIGSLGGTSGAMIKRGAGTLTLIGASSLDWTVEAGGLVTAAERFAGKAAIGAGARFTFDQAANAAYAGQLSGTGSLVKTGAGTLVLDGNNATFSGTTSVSAGALIVGSDSTSTGAVLGGSVAVAGGATLGGHGTIGSGAGSTVAIGAGGTLSPGNSIGTLTVDGNLAFAAGATYSIEVSPQASDRVNVTGTATLGGAAVAATYAAGSYVNKRYTILNAAGGVTGAFSGPVNTNLPASFGAALAYDATNAYLDLTLNYVPPGPTPGANLTVNQANVAAALVNSFNATGGIPLVFGALTPAGLSGASGEAATGIQAATVDVMDRFLNLMTDPYSNGRNTSATQMADLGRGPRAVFVPEPTRWSAWAAGYGGVQALGGNGVIGSHGTSTSIYGTAVGADYRVSSDTTIGFALGAAGTSYRLGQGLGGGSSDVFQIGLYGRHQIGAAYVAAALAYGWQDVTTERRFMGDRLTGRFTANAFSGRIETGYRFALGFAGLTPYAAGQFVSYALPDYREQVTSGTGLFALDYAGRSATAWRTELGLRADKAIQLGEAELTLRGRLAWAHNFNVDRLVGASFSSLPASSFIVHGASQAADVLLTSAGAELKWTNGWSAAATFEGGFSARGNSYAGRGTIRYQW